MIIAKAVSQPNELEDTISKLEGTRWNAVAAYSSQGFSKSFASAILSPHP